MNAEAVTPRGADTVLNKHLKFVFLFVVGCTCVSLGRAEADDEESPFCSLFLTRPTTSLHCSSWLTWIVAEMAGGRIEKSDFGLVKFQFEN
jgi:hypothetical protein